MHLKTLEQHHIIIDECKSLFEKKTKDYGTSWRILRLSSITDQIMIKAQRIRALQEKDIQMIDDDIGMEFIGIVNYCIIALLQIYFKDSQKVNMIYEEISPIYDKITDEITSLLKNKNHDYEEAWREMRVSSITDIILMKLLRIKQIEDNKGKTIISEGVAANYHDIVNYAVFALIKLGYGEVKDS